MCCNNFWKKITIFSITLLIGFFAAQFFRNEEPINVQISIPIINNKSDLQKVSPSLPQSKRKNCVPDDPNLKYQSLHYSEGNSEFSDSQIKQFKLRAELGAIKANADLSEDLDYETVKKTEKEIKRLEKEIEMLEPFLEKPGNAAQMQNLLYLEKCSDYGESMKIVPAEK